MAKLHTVGSSLIEDGYKAEVLDVKESGEWLFGKVFAVTAKVIQCDDGCYYAEKYGRKVGDVYTFDQHLSMGDLAA